MGRHSVIQDAGGSTCIHRKTHWVPGNLGLTSRPVCWGQNYGSTKGIHSGQNPSTPPPQKNPSKEAFLRLGPDGMGEATGLFFRQGASARGFFPLCQSDPSCPEQTPHTAVCLTFSREPIETFSPHLQEHTGQSSFQNRQEQTDPRERDVHTRRTWAFFFPFATLPTAFLTPASQPLPPAVCLPGGQHGTRLPRPIQ